MTKQVHRAHTILSDWRFWIVLAFFGLALTVVGLYFVNQKTSREEATRAALTRAANSTQVGQCFTSVKNAPLTRGFLNAQQAIIDNGLLANRASLKASPPNDPLRLVRLRSIHRLEAAQKNVNALRKLVDKNTPTKAKCVKTAHQLGVDPARYLKKH